MRGGRYIVVIVDDHDLFAQGLALLLNSQSHGRFEVGGHTTYVEEASSVAASCDADLAIIDLAMPPLGGVAAIRHLKAHCPGVKVLALSGTDDLDLAEQALRAGADGFLPKTSDPSSLHAPLLAMMDDVRVLSAPLLDLLLHSSRKPDRELMNTLGSQDIRLWTFLARGMETPEIAERMHVSDRTAKRLVSSLLRKIGAANRVEAAGLAGWFGLLNEPGKPTRERGGNHAKSASYGTPGP